MFTILTISFSVYFSLALRHLWYKDWEKFSVCAGAAFILFYALLTQLRYSELGWVRGLPFE